MRHLTLLALSLAACTSAQPPAAETPANGRANLPASPTKPFTVNTIGQFDEPFAMAFLPDGDLLVTEKAGKLKLRSPDRRITDIAGVPTVATGGQGGLLDVAIAPDYANTGAIYLSYAEPAEGGSQLVLARAQLALDNRAGAPRLTDVRVLWRSGSPGKGGQFGAVIAFAPDGKSLFLASGERQRFTPAQDPDQALGKIVHLTPDGRPAPDNPGAGKTGAATVQVIDPPKDTAAAATAAKRPYTFPGPNTAPAVTWSTGHRNPYGLAFDAGGRLWEVEMGPKGGDELNLIQRGADYGWPRASNGGNYDGLDIPDHRPGDGFVAPKLWWNPSISPGGMIIYSGDRFPAWKGSALIAGLGSQALLRAKLDGDRATPAEQWDMGDRIRDIAQASDGSVWLLGDGGKLMQLLPK